MIDGYEAYRYYLALKLHFTTDKYDVFESNGRVCATRASYEKRNDKALFERLAKKKTSPRDIIDFYVSNFAYYNLHMIYDQSGSEKIHSKWMKNKESIGYNFSRDCSLIERQSEKNPFDASDGSPTLLNMYVSDQIGIETMSILNDYDGYIDRWNNISFIWCTQFRTIRKIKKFIKYDSDKLYSTYNNLKEALRELNHGTNVSGT